MAVGASAKSNRISASKRYRKNPLIQNLIKIREIIVLFSALLILNTKSIFADCILLTGNA